MPKLRISALEGRALLDVGSYARRGPGRRDRLSPEEVALVGRTVRRTPEVMVKVLAKDSNNLRSLAPLPKDELIALKQVVSELSAIGSNLNQIARAASSGAHVAGVGHEEFRAMLKVCEALRDHTKSLIKANAATWVSGHAETQD